MARMVTPAQPAPVRIGALAPLTRPGWVEAGRHLLAGMEAAVRDVNASGGVAGAPVVLEVHDTAADPARAAAAVTALARSGADAVAGEYHSVVARTAAATADALGLPYLCASAVLDALTDAPSGTVARIAPPQSRGWRLFADHLLAAGHTRVAVAAQPSVYWAAGTEILRDRLAPHGGTVRRLDAGATGPAQLCDALADDGATALLLLVGHPEPAVPLVREVRSDPRLAEVLIGAPAGQPEFAEWARLLGDDGAAVPFLRYLPDTLTPLGDRVRSALRERLPGGPSFVAFEGYDTITALAALLVSHRTGTSPAPGSWDGIDVQGTRGRIRFTRTPDSPVPQWSAPPIQVVDRDPARPDRFRVLRTAG
ncbi:ABC transporter substrate-binding protein [Streptomyces sp. SID5785]|uniref:ABC transporter substrate-binding protein n=1 Tax=Streptomyces sp. SID5785 TaxID=2690309 RepID=UPI001360CF10|nr:ABC transporter substrate-binding protein [Streptomyces sp. SID5785]MZD04431.1 ABC transporter substrate-binding protein [Streptomyces sp. SID5785]